MLSLALTLVLSTTPPPPVEAWAQKACPASKKEPDSNIEFKARLEARSTCLKRAMNRALDKVIVPLKKKEPAAFQQWMELQAQYNRWMADACAAVEGAHWVELSTGERLLAGTGFGTTEQQCLQRQYAWRGFYADAWARKDWKALSTALDTYARTAPQRQEQLSQYQQKAQQAAASAPAQASAAEDASLKMTREDWKDYNGRLERAASGPQALAERQCALVPQPAPSCAAAFRASLLWQLDFSEALGGPGDG